MLAIECVIIGFFFSFKYEILEFSYIKLNFFYGF